MNLCANCNQREGTIYWAGERDPSDAMRQLYGLPKWCEVCATKAQIAHVEKQLKRLPELKKKLKDLE